MSHCLSAFLSVEKRAGELFEIQAAPVSLCQFAAEKCVFFFRADGKLPLWSCKDSNIVFKQSAQHATDLLD